MAAFLVKVVDHMTDFSVVEDTCKVKKKKKKQQRLVVWNKSKQAIFQSLKI